MGVQGAKRSRYFPSSPDALLRKLVEKNPKATDSELEDLFEEQVLKHGGSLLSAIIAYWFANRHRALVREMTPAAVLRARKERGEKRLQQQVETVKRAAVAKIARTLLDRFAPACGKKIGDMTKEDCIREGGWYTTLATKLRARQTVKQARLTDAELWALYNS
jgi:DNA invertase Pin-like site-specific DNA recombinase